MRAAARPYVMASAVLVAASVVATPLAPRPLQLPILSIETRLVDATDSILNVPINLFDDILNIPYNEVQALDTFGEFAVAQRELVGTELDEYLGYRPRRHDACPGDSGFAAAVPGVGQRLRRPGIPTRRSVGGRTSGECLLRRAQPARRSSRRHQITGITGIDRLIELFETLPGKTPISACRQLVQGADFGAVARVHLWTSAAPTPVSSTPAARPYDPALGFSNDPSNYFLGGTGAGNTMPWDGHTFTLNLLPAA